MIIRNDCLNMVGRTEQGFDEQKSATLLRWHKAYSTRLPNTQIEYFCRIPHSLATPKRLSSIQRKATNHYQKLHKKTDMFSFQKFFNDNNKTGDHHKKLESIDLYRVAT